ncbi:TonB-dependent receptor [Ferrimonas pelagia]|uniref:TonB-dependent receptor n=1 Tax=Ferrimonas pelagia TaxID=1177826 RepID=A0ABP9F249_9GAMM
MKYPSRIAQAVKIGLAASSVAAIGISAPAMAQTAVAENVERISVTGSRISRQDMENASPVTIIDSAAIKAEGFVSVDQILQSQPSMGGMASGSTTNNGSDGAARVDLRGMGASRTLVLVDGRRMINSGSGGDSTVDLNSIPVAMIQRVEILKDGASAVYGSDAIAGVVNIITKKYVEGFQFDINGGISDKGDGENYDLSALYGIQTGLGSINVGLAYSERKGVIQSDRDWVPAGESSLVPGGSLSGYKRDADGEYILNEKGDRIATSYVPGENGWAERDFGYDFTKDSYFQTPSKRYSLFANTSLELTDNIQFNGDVIYTNRDSKQQMASQPANEDLKVCPAGTTGLDCVSLTNDMLAAGIEANEDGIVNYRRRMVEVGPRIYEQDVETLRASAGFSGYLEFGNGLDWDVSYTYGRNRADTWVHNSVNATNLTNNIYANQDAWFSGKFDDISAEMIDDISYLQTQTGGNDLHVLSGVVSGDLFELPAGAVAFALGADYRRESGFYNPDPVIVAGDGTAAQQDPTDGSYNVTSAFTEFAIPVADGLLAEAALRYDYYSTFGSSTTWKLGVTYEVSDELMLRGVAATGFRAPNITELFGGNSGSFDYLTDPWGREQDSQILVNYSPDPNLEAEESESLTLGAVLTLDSIEGLSFAIDYWAFDVTNAISRLNVQERMNACYEGDLTACNDISITVDGDLSDMTNPLTNVGTQTTRGIDFNTQYSFSGLGLDWTLINDLTYLLEFKEDGVDYRGTIDGMNGAYAEVKNNFSLAGRHDKYSFMYSARYIGEMESPHADVTVSARTYHNISGTYDVSQNVTATLGIRNLADKLPPSVPNGNEVGTVPEVYDVIGRTYFGGVTIRF